MATLKYKVLKTFSDQYTNKTYLIDQEIELTDERFKEMNDNLEAFGGGYLEEIKEETENADKAEEVKEEKQKKKAKTK